MKTIAICFSVLLLTVFCVRAQTPPGISANPGPAVPASMQTSPAQRTTPAPNAVFVSVFAAMTLVALMGFLFLGRILRQDKDWTFADAMSGADGKPSASRLIAFLGFLVIVAVILGISYSTIWVFLETGQLPVLSGATTFLLACAGLFTPYLANQIGIAVSPAAAQQGLAPVVVQTANSVQPLNPSGVPAISFGAPVRPGS
jgi:hypothetical protein